MRIGIDIRVLVEGKRTGVEEYTLNLLEYLFKIDRKNQYKLFCNAYRATSLDISQFQKCPNVKIYKFRWPNKILNLSFKFLKFPKIDKMVDGLDLFYAPNILFFSLSNDCKNVVTFHDLSFEYYSNFFSLKRKSWHFLVNPRKIAQRADKIIAVSNSTKQDLIEKYNISSDKIRVIYSGINKNFRPINDKKILKKVQEKYYLPEKFILFLGTFEPRKNIEGLIFAFKKLKEKFKIPYKLVLAGERGWLSRNIFRLIKKFPFKQEIIPLGFIEDKDKPVLYNLASIFVYPSFYEGFGFPPLEAMACGVPTIVSSISSMPEITNGKAVLIDPYNISELSEAIYQILNDENLQKKLSRDGILQAKRFNWENSAKETFDLFNSFKK